MSLQRLRGTDPVAVLALLVSAIATLLVSRSLESHGVIGQGRRVLAGTLPAIVLAGWALARATRIPPPRRRLGVPLVALAIAVAPAYQVSMDQSTVGILGGVYGGMQSD